MIRQATRIVACAATVTVILAGCSSTKSSSSSSTTSGGSTQSAAGPGVTASTITLGYMTDLSGPASASGKIDLHGTQLYLDQLNKAGGVCGRQIKLMAQDTQYDVQKALVAYEQSEPNVLAYMAVLGSPILASLSSRFQADKVMTTTLGWDSVELKNPYYVVLPTTSDMDMVAGLNYLSQQGLLHKGDTIGEFAIQGLGIPQEPGVQYVADQLGLKVDKVELAPTVSDVATQVAQFKSAGATVIVAEGLPTQTAAAATAAGAAGMSIPILTGPAGFVPQVMSSASAQYLSDHLYEALAWSPFSADNPGVKEVQTAFTANPGGLSPDDSIVLGWTQAKAMTELIGKSCDALTRDGLQKTLRATNNLSLPGLTGDLNFTDPSQHRVGPTTSCG